MDPIVSLFSILGALILGCISPGPSFVFVMRTSVATSRRDGIAAALGMGLGAAIVCTLSLLGVRIVLAQAQWLYLVFKAMGGAYLIFLAWRIWRGAQAPASATAPDAGPTPSSGILRSFLLALATQFSNPKTLIIISGIFAALLPPQVPGWMYFAIPPIDLVIESSWYAFVAVAMSSTGPRLAYLRARKGIDRTIGGVLGALGIRLIVEGAREAA